MIRYREGALRDIAEAAGWYRRRRPAYEGRFLERLRETLRHIEDAPLNCAIAMEAEGVRKARVHRTPYSIAYSALTKDEIEIIAVVHGARRPGWWTRRLRRGK
jgi:plasmid stabilization system protein ParE